MGKKETYLTKLESKLRSPHGVVQTTPSDEGVLLRVGGSLRDVLVGDRGLGISGRRVLVVGFEALAIDRPEFVELDSHIVTEVDQTAGVLTTIASEVGDEVWLQKCELSAITPRDVTHDDVSTMC